MATKLTISDAIGSRLACSGRLLTLPIIAAMAAAAFRLALGLGASDAARRS
jgi:hypothetical protein